MNTAPTYATSLCMNGSILTKEKCPKCGRPFKRTEKGFVCRRCKTTPKRYFLAIYAQGYGTKTKKLYTGPDGHVLDSWERAHRLLTTIRYEMDQGTFDIKKYLSVHLKPLQFGNYIQAWVERRDQDCQQQEISRAYLKVVKGYVRNYFIPFFGNQDIRKVRKGHLEDFLRQLPQHLSSKTRYNMLGVLHKVFRDALEREDITKMPLFPKVRKREAKTRFVTRREQQNILAHAHGVYRDFFNFLMLTGLRTSEGRALRWEDVDLKNDLVHVRGSFDLGVYKPYTKTGEGRYLPLSPAAKEILKNQPRALAGWVFINSQGRHLSEPRIRAAWKSATRAAGIDITLYEATRHSFASQAISSGVPERLIGEALGHKHASTTRRYAKMKADALKTVMDAVGNQPGN